MKFVTIGMWDVIPAIADHETVHIIDKEKRAVLDVNELTLSEWATIFSHDNTDGRYDFWMEVEEDEQETSR